LEQCEPFILNASTTRTKPFEPGAAMDIKRVRGALAKLKAEHFPELEIDVFFRAGGGGPASRK